jgi:hypothetical protein
MAHTTMAYEGMAWSRGKTVDDLSVGDFDGGFVRESMEEKMRHLGPLSREFLGFITSHPKLWSIWYEGWPYTIEEDTLWKIPLRDPKFKELILKKLDYVLAKDKAMLDAKKIKLSLMLMPYRNFIGMGELDGEGKEWSPATVEPVLNAPFKALAAKRGVEVYDPLDMMRLMDPALFPLFSYADIHWLPTTHQAFAWMMVQQYYYGDR